MVGSHLLFHKCDITSFIFIGIFTCKHAIVDASLKKSSHCAESFLQLSTCAETLHKVSPCVRSLPHTKCAENVRRDSARSAHICAESPAHL